MKHFLPFLLLFIGTQIWSQSPVEMTPQGFAPITLKTPDKPNEKLIAISKNWAATYNKEGYDVTNVTENSLVISALKQAAAFYYNIGVKYDYNIRYDLKVVFNADKTYTLTFIAKEFYNNEILTKTTVADFFTPEGKLKDDFRDVKPSLENTVERILKSYSSFISN